MITGTYSQNPVTTSIVYKETTYQHCVKTRPFKLVVTHTHNQQLILTLPPSRSTADFDPLMGVIALPPIVRLVSSSTSNPVKTSCAVFRKIPGISRVDRRRGSISAHVRDFQFSSCGVLGDINIINYQSISITDTLLPPQATNDPPTTQWHLPKSRAPAKNAKVPL